MNDFSKLGLVVSHLAQTLAVLRAGGFTVRGESDWPLVEIADQGQISGIIKILEKNDLNCEMSDLVSCVYQG
jgi:hypothetical protein